jgi:hypothetical protein
VVRFWVHDVIDWREDAWRYDNRFCASRMHGDLQCTSYLIRAGLEQNFGYSTASLV